MLSGKFLKPWHCLLLAGLLGGCAELRQPGPDDGGLGGIETSQGLMLVVKDVLFDVNQSSLRSEAWPVIDKVAALLASQPERNVLVAGHADNRGSADYNQALSRRRAETVREALVEKGITPGRILIKDYGETRPVASNDTAEGRQKNRRVEITLLNPGALLD